jgi:hypothetical protein
MLGGRQLLLLGRESFTFGSCGALLCFGRLTVCLELADLGEVASFRRFVTTGLDPGGATPLRPDDARCDHRDNSDNDDDCNEDVHDPRFPQPTTLETTSLHWGFGTDSSSKERFGGQPTGNKGADDKGAIMLRRTHVTEDSAPVIESGYVAEGRTVEAVTPPWSPLQIIGLIAGIGFGVLGIAAVARTGFDTSHIYTPHDLVWSFPHSPLLGVIEIGFGFLMVLGSVVPGGWRSFLALLGAISLAFGIVVLIEEVPNRLNDWLAVSHRNGWLYVATGGVVLLAALFAPVFGGVEREHRALHRDTVLN